MRRAAKVDANQSDCVDYLRANGWSVFIASAFGRGFLDLIVSRLGFTCLLEVKDGSRVPSERRLTEDQEDFVRDWQGKWAKVESPEQALKAARRLKDEYDWEAVMEHEMRYGT